MIEPEGWRWTKAAPAFLPVIGPSEQRRALSSNGGRGRHASTSNGVVEAALSAPRIQ